MMIINYILFLLYLNCTHNYDADSALKSNIILSKQNYTQSSYAARCGGEFHSSRARLGFLCAKTMKKTLKYRGVSWSKAVNKWHSQIQIKGIKIHLGYFLKEQDAAKAYTDAEKKEYSKTFKKMHPKFDYNGGIVQIPLSSAGHNKTDNHGKYWAIINIDDFEKIKPYKWHVDVNKYCKNIYARNNNKVRMHRLIMGITNPAILVDHKDGNGLNNRRSNLRICTATENAQNTKILQKNDKTSKFKGVSLDKRRGIWRARMSNKGKKIWIGMYKSEIDAAKAYDTKVRELHGEFAKLNLPLKG